MYEVKIREEALNLSHKAFSVSRQPATAVLLIYDHTNNFSRLKEKYEPKLRVVVSFLIILLYKLPPNSNLTFDNVFCPPLNFATWFPHRKFPFLKGITNYVVCRKKSGW